MDISATFHPQTADFTFFSSAHGIFSRIDHILVINLALVSLKRASLVAWRLKRLSAMRETWVLSLGWEDSLDKKMATHSSTLAWRIPWTEEPGGLQSTGSQRVGHD